MQWVRAHLISGLAALVALLIFCAVRGTDLESCPPDSQDNAWQASGATQLHKAPWMPTVSEFGWLSVFWQLTQWAVDSSGMPCRIRKDLLADSFWLSCCRQGCCWRASAAPHHPLQGPQPPGSPQALPHPHQGPVPLLEHHLAPQHRHKLRRVAQKCRSQPCLCRQAQPQPRPSQAATTPLCGTGCTLAGT